MISQKKRRILFTSIILVFCFCLAGAISHSVYAGFEEGDYTQSSGVCGKSAPYCYNTNNVVWVYSKFTSSDGKVDLSQVGAFAYSAWLYPGGGASSIINCSQAKEQGAEGAYILAETWYKSNTAQSPSGFFFPLASNKKSNGQLQAIQKKDVGYPNELANGNSPDGKYFTESVLARLEYTPGSKTWSYVNGYWWDYPSLGDDHGKQTLVYHDGSYATTNKSFVYEQYVGWKSSTTGISKERAIIEWNEGEFSYFCGSDIPVESQYQSRSTVAATGRSTQTSGWGNWAGTTMQNIEVKPGQTIDITFNHYLKYGNAEQKSTDWEIKRFVENPGAPAGTTFTDLSSGATANYYSFGTLSPLSNSNFTTYDANEHSVIGSSGRTVRVSIPADINSTTSFKMCEQIEYSVNKEAQPGVRSGSYACAIITIKPDQSGGYESKSQAYSPADSGFVTSEKDGNWPDGATDEILELPAITNTDSSQEIVVHFNHYIRRQTAGQANTDWEVNLYTQGSIPSYIRIQDVTRSRSLGSSYSGTLAEGNLPTTGTTSYALPYSSSNHQIKIIISPKTGSVNDTITLCEEIKYQKDNTKSSDKNGSSHVCVRLKISNGGDTGTCPLPASLYNKPAPGTTITGTTTSGSGIRSNVFQEYSDFIYAKPTDKINWAHCYFPEAQAVRYTDEADNHPSPGNYGDDPPLSNTVGPQDGIVSTSNKVSMSTTNTSDFSPSVGFTLSSNSDGFTVSGNTITGKKIGATDSAIIYSKGGTGLYYTIRTGSAGDTITQTLATDTGTNSVSSHNTWSYSYSYDCPCSHSCPSGCGSGEGKTPCSSCHDHDTCTGTGTGTHSQTFYTISTTTSYNSDSSHASVYVPYNFVSTDNTTNIAQTGVANSDSANQVVFAGENFNVTGTVNIYKRDNAVTDGSYATEPPSDTKVQIVKFYLASWESVPSGSSNSTPDEQNLCNYYGGSVHSCKIIYNKSRDYWMGSNPFPDGKTYNISAGSTVAYNIPAGYRICTAIGISHKDSLNDTNNSAAGDVNDLWDISAPTCRTVARKTSVQIWGGSLFTNGTLRTSSSTKSMLSRTFGSWDEFALIAGGNSGKISGMASGASLGYTNSYSSNSRSGGNSSSLFSTRLSLTIPNSSCSGSTCTASGINSNSTIMNRLISRFATADIISGNSLDLSLASSYKMYGNYRYTHAKNNDLTITMSQAMSENITHIVYVEGGDVIINGNLLYDSGNQYQTINDIPQLVIITQKNNTSGKGGNIKISNWVQQIDAWLIATGNIDTCSGFSVDGGNASINNCGSKLTINGPVIADSITLERTFGAGAQDSSGQSDGISGQNYINFSDQYSVTSAEVINLPITAYLWAYGKALDNPRAYTVYTRQLAPRL